MIDIGKRLAEAARFSKSALVNSKQLDTTDRVADMFDIVSEHVHGCMTGTKILVSQLGEINRLSKIPYDKYADESDGEWE